MIEISIDINCIKFKCFQFSTLNRFSVTTGDVWIDRRVLSGAVFKIFCPFYMNERDGKR